MPQPFRWNLEKREQLGSLADGHVAEAYRGFIDELRRCCARVVAACDDADLVFVGRSPENLHDYLRGLLPSDWRDRCSHLNVSTRAMNRRQDGQAYAPRGRYLAEQLHELRLDPHSLIHRDRPVAFVDIVCNGNTFGHLISFLFNWAASDREDLPALQRSIRIVGLTEAWKPSPNTWRWQDEVDWVDQLRRRDITNVAVSADFWWYLAGRQDKVTPSYAPDRWGRLDALKEPPRDPKRLKALRLALKLHELGKTSEHRCAFAADLAATDGMKHRWFRELVSSLRQQNRTPRF